MTSPVSQDDSAISPTSHESHFTGRFVRAGIGLTKLARSPSSGSLNSVLSLMNDPSSGEQNFRLCVHCKDLLDARERLKARQFVKPAVTRHYDEMRIHMEEATRYMSMYSKMWDSLRYKYIFSILPLIVRSISRFDFIYIKTMTACPTRKTKLFDDQDKFYNNNQYCPVKKHTSFFTRQRG